MVNIYLRVLSRPVEKHLAQLHRDFRGNHNERVFNSIGNEVLKSVVAQYVRFLCPRVFPPFVRTIALASSPAHTPKRTRDAERTPAPRAPCAVTSKEQSVKTQL